MSKPYYLLDVGDKVQTRRGVVGIVRKVYQNRYLVLELADGSYYSCDKKVCKFLDK